MFKVIMSMVLFLSQAFGQNVGEPSFQGRDIKAQVEYLESNIRLHGQSLEFQIKRLAVLQDYIEKGATPVYVESRNTAAIVFALSVLGLYGAIKVIDLVEQRKLSPGELAALKKRFKENGRATIVPMVILVGGLLMTAAAGPVINTKYNTDYLRKLEKMDESQLEAEHKSFVEGITRTSELIQSSQLQLNSLKK